jgi:hypothetical protein
MTPLRPGRYQLLSDMIWRSLGYYNNPWWPHLGFLENDLSDSVGNIRESLWSSL